MLVEKTMICINSKTISKLTPIRKSDYGAIENIIDSESESISSSTQFRQECKPQNKIGKIIISPLERTGTVNSNELVRINSIVSKVIPIASPTQLQNKSRNIKIMEYNTANKRQSISPKFKKSSDTIASPDNL